MGVKGISTPVRTVLELREYMRDVGPINSYGFYQLMQERGKQRIGGAQPGEREAGEAYLAVSYSSIRKLFWMLRQVEAIEFDHEEPSKGGKPRAFYRMVNEAWFVVGLQRHFWPYTTLGGMRYRSYVRRGQPPPMKEPPGEPVPERPYSRYWEAPVPEALPSKPARRPRRRRRPEGKGRA